MSTVVWRLVAAFCLCLPSLATASNILDDLDQSQQALVDISCTPRHFAQGVDAYRECLQQELAVIESGIELDDQTLSSLSFDEQYAIQRACAAASQTSSNAYSACTRQQLGELILQPEPDLSQISKDEQYMLTQQCFDTQTNAGGGQFRGCINAALASLGALPAADFSQNSDAQKNDIQLECSIVSDNVSTYRICLLNALGIEFEQSTTAATASLPADTALKPDTLPEPAMESSDVASLPLEQTGQQSATVTYESQELALAANVAGSVNSRMPTTDNNSTNTTTGLTATDSQRALERPESGTSGIFSRLQSAIAALSLTHWIALLAALSMPLMFFIIKPAQQKTVVSTAVPERHPDDEHHHRRRNRKRDTSASNRRRNISTYVPAPPPDDETLSANQDSTSENTLDDEALYLDQTFTVELPVLRGQHALASHQPTERITSMEAEPQAKSNLRFIDWLENFEASQQQEYAIEYLIYWVAYADNRFDPALKQRVLQMRNPDAQNLIKRWVFKKDANAFADAISFLQSHTSSKQRQQILDLLMALLVAEIALTPAQNNLLRFLSDAFGIGNAGLNEQYNRAYGQLMPPVPRPDKVMWWKQLSSEQRLRWDARAIARQPDNIRYRIALGQPLQGDLNKTDVEKSFTLATGRCDPKRVNLLGAREASLMTTQRKKFVAARASLLEPIT